jgi:hypothetical protein
VFKFTITTVRPTTDAPFYINTAEGQVYEEQMNLARASRPSSEDQPNALLSFVRTTSVDGLTLTSAYSFTSSVGKDELFAEIDTRATTNGMTIFQTVRDAYNVANNHVTTVEAQII